MNRLVLLVCVLLMSAGVWSQTSADPKCISIMGVPLEGPEFVFIKALKTAGFEQTAEAEDDEPDTYYFTGDFYGIKSKLMVSVDSKTKLLSEAMVTCGPYRTREMFDRNQKYLLLKLQREWGDFDAKGDGSLYKLTDYGYIQQSTIFGDDGTYTIRYYYLNSSPYYKDAANMALRGFVQEVITENPVAEEAIVHFNEQGKIDGPELVDRVYNEYGYLQSAAMVEQTGEKSLLTYEYDDDFDLIRRTLVNASTGIRSVNEYKYNGSHEITQQSQKVFDNQNECVVSINMKHDVEERDDTGNWTKNKMSLTYWEKGQRAQIVTVNQLRTISYWDEE